MNSLRNVAAALKKCKKKKGIFKEKCSIIRCAEQVSKVVFFSYRLHLYREEKIKFYKMQYIIFYLYTMVHKVIQLILPANNIIDHI